MFGLAAALFLIVNCGSARAIYKFQIKQVARGDAQLDESRGVKPPLEFENADFKLAWTPGPSTYYFRLENKAKADLQINFAKSILISSSGNAFSVVHPGNSSIAKGSDTLIIPSGVGVDSWVRPGQKQGANEEGLAGALAPGISGGGFFPESGNAADLKADYAGKKITVLLNIAKSGKEETYRFTLVLVDVLED